MFHKCWLFHGRTFRRMYLLHFASIRLSIDFVVLLQRAIVTVSKDDKENYNPLPLDYFVFPLSKSLATGLEGTYL